MLRSGIGNDYRGITVEDSRVNLGFGSQLISDAVRVRQRHANAHEGSAIDNRRIGYRNGELERGNVLTVVDKATERETVLVERD